MDVEHFFDRDSTEFLRTSYSLSNSGFAPKSSRTERRGCTGSWNSLLVYRLQLVEQLLWIPKELLESVNPISTFEYVTEKSLTGE